MRNVLNIAITEMVYREGHDEKIRDNTCDVPGSGPVAARDGFEWSEQLQGIILGAFFWGYVRDLKRLSSNRSKVSQFSGCNSRSWRSYFCEVWREVHTQLGDSLYSNFHTAYSDHN